MREKGIKGHKRKGSLMSHTPQPLKAPEPASHGRATGSAGVTAIKIKSLPTESFATLRMIFVLYLLEFKGVRLADLQAGRVDDFVLVWSRQVEGHSIKWSGDASPMNWGDLIGAKGLVKELAQGFLELCQRWPDRTVTVRLQTNRPPSLETHANQLISAFSVAEFRRDHWKKGPTAEDSDVLKEAWGKIAKHTGLSPEDFGAFVKGCIFPLGFTEPPGSGPDTWDWRHYKRQFDDLHKAIATWLTNNPDLEFINREFLPVSHWVSWKSLRADPKISPASDTVRAERGRSRSAEATDRDRVRRLHCRDRLRRRRQIDARAGCAQSRRTSVFHPVLCIPAGRRGQSEKSG